MGSLGWPPAAELLEPLPAVEPDEELLESLDPLELPAVELELAEPPVEVLLPLADGEDLLDEQPAASSAATARVVPVRTSDVRRDVTEDHAPEEYSRPLPPDIPSSPVRVHRHTSLIRRGLEVLRQMSRLDALDRRARVAVGAALGFVGVMLLVLGWYLISGEAIAGKQLPYLASASIPGAVLVVCGFELAISGSTDPDTARRIAELHALLTEAVDDLPGESGTTGTDPIGGDPIQAGPTEAGPIEAGPTAAEE